jgi:hypothetical protein
LTTASQPNTAPASIFRKTRLSPSPIQEEPRSSPIREEPHSSPIQEQPRKSPIGVQPRKSPPRTRSTPFPAKDATLFCRAKDDEGNKGEATTLVEDVFQGNKGQPTAMMQATSKLPPAMT